MKKPTRKECINARVDVRSHIAQADVLFDPNPHAEGEQTRYDRAQSALDHVVLLLTREEG
jgi:hypothetical protein